VLSGPGCPTAAAGSTHTFTLTPKPETSSVGCVMGMGAIGRLVNGISFYGWSDGLSYNSKGVWHNLGELLYIYLFLITHIIIVCSD